MDEEKTFRQFERELSLQKEALQTLFRYATQSTELTSFASEMATGADPLSDSYPGSPLWDTDWDAMKVMHEWHKWTNIATVKTYSRGIYAGSLFLVLNNWIQSLGMQLGIKQQEERLNEGEIIGKTQLSRLIWATANNFRHYNEWASPSKLAEQSIIVLKDAEIGEPMNRNLAADVLQRIDAENYEALEAKILSVGQALKNKAS